MSVNSSHFSLKHLLAFGVVFLSLGLVLEPLQIPQLSSLKIQPATASPICDKIIKPNATLSPQDLNQVKKVAPGKSRATIRGILQEPYCRLSNLQIRARTTAERETYPLAADSHTWLVVLYEGESYAGYDFWVR